MPAVVEVLCGDNLEECRGRQGKESRDYRAGRKGGGGRERSPGTRGWEEGWGRSGRGPGS